jgi:SAM-dependent methyltransferase
MTTANPSDAPSLDRIADLLICPGCSESLAIRPEAASCPQCGAKYPIRDGIPLLARMGTTDTWTGGSDPAELDSKQYQEQYHEVARAAEYNAAYRERLFKRMSTAREYGLLKRLLQSQGHCGMILELPCGGGRLSPQIAPFADLLVEADIAEGQVLYGKRNVTSATPRIWLTASAFHIPFREGSFDGAVCVRLCHHLPAAIERERLIRELLRVSKRFVIMTFFDYHSVKNLLRRMRQPFDHKPPKMTMTVDEVARLAARHGAKLAECPALASLSSGHRYALMVKGES